ncbi:MAG: putative zinc-binding metallopeptidase [Halorhodospira sp.]
MQVFSCACGNRLHFGNTRCLACGRALGFDPGSRQLLALEPDGEGRWRAPTRPGQPSFRDCANHRAAGCDWLVPAGCEDTLCLACRLTLTIPDLDSEVNRLYWRRLEAAKRYLIYDLLRLGLPVADRWQDPERGLVFEFLADAETPDGLQQILTGHGGGRITINVAEADEVYRERMRVALGEAYRTLLGHMRHEIGHYYWMRLIEASPWIERFRALFGDEREPYQEALQRYYRYGPQDPDWARRHISAYAASHPWEDWAETWAHYLHITDALETAAVYGLTDPVHPTRTPVAELLERWHGLSEALNALSRSLGQRDPYPFQVTEPVAEKLALVQAVVGACYDSGGAGSSSKSRCSPSRHD